MGKFLLFDDRKDTYKSLVPFEWPGEITETPWGKAAYLKDGIPEKMATGKIGGFFGSPNGKTWDSLSPRRILETPEEVAFDINSEDIFKVYPELGGGYVGYGRHDGNFTHKDVCLLGELYSQRFSNGEAFKLALISLNLSDLRKSMFGPNTSITFDLVDSWHKQYKGSYQWRKSEETLQGTRSELKMPGGNLPNWSMATDVTERYRVLFETIFSDNVPFAIRKIPIEKLS